MAGCCRRNGRRRRDAAPTTRRNPRSVAVPADRGRSSTALRLQYQADVGGQHAAVRMHQRAARRARLPRSGPARQLGPGLGHVRHAARHA
ncbi:hypothetical protein CNMCM8686_000654 [Aspergillus fumigatus]|nr:hypothetical protein CNMCM8686_000654 [Aspergillus fumigatus]